MIKVRCTGRRATCTSLETITSGSAGMPLHICYDAAWSDLRKIVVCKAGDVSFDVLDLGGGDLRIPHEVLQVSGVHLLVGVCGVDLENQIVIPTVYADCGLIVEGTNPQEDVTLDPTLPVWAQLVNNMGNLANLDTQVKDNLVAAINEVLASGGVDPEVVAEAVEQYMAEHPLEEADPTVPAWAKEPEKPSYTPQEVGADPAGTAAAAVAAHDADEDAHEALFAEKASAQSVSSLTGRVAAIEGKESGWDAKQDAISDLDEIRQNAEDGATAAVSVINILEKIPPAATSDNKLADRAFVNSTVGTNTAIFRGTFNSVAELEDYSGDKTNNDYAFVVTTDTTGNTVYNRYKYNGSAWVFEFALNNSSFTAVQWAAIQSGITAEAVALIATALQPSDLNPYRTASAQDVIDALLQPKAVTIQHITATTVEGALAEVGLKLDGLETALDGINDVLEGAL